MNINDYFYIKVINNWIYIIKKIDKKEEKIIGFICDTCELAYPLSYRYKTLTGKCCSCEEKILNKMINEG